MIVYTLFSLREDFPLYGIVAVSPYSIVVILLRESIYIQWTGLLGFTLKGKQFFSE